MPHAQRRVRAMLMALSTTVSVAIAATVAFIIGVLAVKLLDLLRKQDAQSEAKRILERAQQDSTSKIREADLEIKERSLREKADNERELNKVRDELRDRERLLDKRQELTEQQTDDLRKQE